MCLTICRKIMLVPNYAALPCCVQSHVRGQRTQGHIRWMTSQSKQKRTRTSVRGQWPSGPMSLCEGESLGCWSHRRGCAVEGLRRSERGTARDRPETGWEARRRALHFYFQIRQPRELTQRAVTRARNVCWICSDTPRRCFHLRFSARRRAGGAGNQHAGHRERE